MLGAASRLGSRAGRAVAMLPVFKFSQADLDGGEQGRLLAAHQKLCPVSG